MKVSELIVLVESYRFKKCLSQRQFAILLDLNQYTYLRTINMITKPSFVTLAKMIKYMNENGHEIELEK